LEITHLKTWYPKKRESSLVKRCPRPYRKQGRVLQISQPAKKKGEVGQPLKRNRGFVARGRRTGGKIERPPIEKYSSEGARIAPEHSKKKKGEDTGAERPDVWS